MIFCKIKDKHLFNSKFPNRFHDYILFYDNKKKKNCLIPLTHLYKKDPKRFSQIKKGYLKKMSFRHFDTPSGVKNYSIIKDLHGKSIVDNSSIIRKRKNVYVSPKQYSDLMRWIKH